MEYVTETGRVSTSLLRVSGHVVILGWWWRFYFFDISFSPLRPSVRSSGRLGRLSYVDARCRFDMIFNVLQSFWSRPKCPQSCHHRRRNISALLERADRARHVHLFFKDIFAVSTSSISFQAIDDRQNVWLKSSIDIDGTVSVSMTTRRKDRKILWWINGRKKKSAYQVEIKIFLYSFSPQFAQRRWSPLQVYG